MVQSGESSCVPTTGIAYSVLLAFLASPCHILIVWVLVKRFRVSIPRYKILASLSISDLSQFALPVVLFVFAGIFKPGVSTLGCRVIRGLLTFNGAFTLVVSSLSIVALSVERYVACLYCLRYYAICTDKRAKRLLICIWVTGLTCGCLTFIPEKEAKFPAMVIPNTLTVKILSLITILSTSLVLMFVQYRLFVLSSQKIKAEPGQVFGRKLEASDLRKQQLKLATVASAVVAFYVLFMSPLGFYFTYSVVSGRYDMQWMRILMCLAFVNNFFDPFLYGFGMPDIRKRVMQELRNIKQRFVNSNEV